MWTCLSRILESVDRMELGLTFPLSCRLPFLCMGTTLEVFHSSVIISELSDKFRILVSGAARAGEPKQRNFGGMPSIPMALPSFYAYRRNSIVTVIYVVI